MIVYVVQRYSYFNYVVPGVFFDMLINPNPNMILKEILIIDKFS